MYSAVRPNGYAALELQDATLHPNDLTDAEIVEAIRAYNHVVSWAGARQAAMLAEFARRRPPDRTDVLDRATRGPVSIWAPDEIGLALTLSRGTAADRIERSLRLEQVLPATLAAWDAGQLDVAKVSAIHDATLCLSDTAARAVQDPGWTVAQAPDGLITWTTPTGHRYSSRPHDNRPEPDLVAVVAALNRATATKGDPFDLPISPRKPTIHHRSDWWAGVPALRVASPFGRSCEFFAADG